MGGCGLTTGCDTTVVNRLEVGVACAAAREMSNCMRTTALITAKQFAQRLPMFPLGCFDPVTLRRVPQGCDQWAGVLLPPGSGTYGFNRFEVNVAPAQQAGVRLDTIEGGPCHCPSYATKTYRPNFPPTLRERLLTVNTRNCSLPPCRRTPEVKTTDAERAVLL